MKKTLIIFIVLLASYLTFDKFSNNENSTENNDWATIEPSHKIDENQEEDYKYKAEIPVETEAFEGEFFEGTYATDLDSEHIKANLSFSFHKNGTFSDYRNMTFPKSLSGEATGTYVIDGAVLSLIYTEERDKNIFKFAKAKMSLQKNGTLKTGTLVLNKQ